MTGVKMDAQCLMQSGFVSQTIGHHMQVSHDVEVSKVGAGVDDGVGNPDDVQPGPDVQLDVQILLLWSKASLFCILDNYNGIYGWFGQICHCSSFFPSRALFSNAFAIQNKAASHNTACNQSNTFLTMKC